MDICLLLIITKCLLSFIIRYTWGNNEYGRLGHLNEKIHDSKKSLNSRSVFLAGVNKPRRVEGDLSDKKVVQAACGSIHTV